MEPESMTGRMGSGASGAGWRRLRAGVLTLAAIMAVATTGGLALAQFFPDAEPPNSEITFGCTPGPIEELHHADPPIAPVRVASPSDPMRTATLAVDTSAGRSVD